MIKLVPLIQDCYPSPQKKLFMNIRFFKNIFEFVCLQSCTKFIKKTVEAFIFSKAWKYVNIFYCYKIFFNFSVKRYFMNLIWTINVEMKTNEISKIKPDYFIKEGRQWLRKLVVQHKYKVVDHYLPSIQHPIPFSFVKVQINYFTF